MMGLLPFVVFVLLLPQIVCAGSFKLGSINMSPVDETKRFLPLANYLIPQLRPAGIDKVDIVVAQSIRGMASLLQSRQVDLYIDSIFPVMAVSRLTGSKLLLRRWKLGAGEYRTIIFTRKDSGIVRLADLKGKIIAFEEPFSSSGYFFPKVDLLKMNFKLTPKRQKSDSVRAEEVGYIYSHGDTSTIFLVLNSGVAAGAVDDQNYVMFAQHLDRFRILHETPIFLRQLVSYRGDLAEDIVSRVKRVLLGMHRTEEGRKALRAFEDTTRFDEIPEQAFKVMAGLRKYVDAELQLQR